MGGAVGGLVSMALTAGGASALTASIVSGIVSMGMNFLMSAFSSEEETGGGAEEQDSSLKTILKTPVGERKIIYGEIKTSGILTYFETTGESNTYAHEIITLSGHTLTSISDIYVNDVVVTLDDDNYATNEEFLNQGSSSKDSINKLLFINKHLGENDQAADTDLISASNSKWTSNHRLRGCGYLYLQLVYDSQKFYTLPTVQALVKGKAVYDFRTETTAYSNNPILCIYDYLTNTDYGLGVGTDEIDLISFIASANICDEDVSLLAGGTEKRYTCNGSFTTDLTPREIISDLLKSCAGTFGYSGGKFFVHAGSYISPTELITESDIIDSVEITTATSRSEKFNSIKGTYTCPLNLYQESDYPQISSSTYIAEDGEVIWMDYSLPYTNSPSMAERLAKIYLEANRRQTQLNLKVNMKFLNIRVGDSVYVTLDRYGFNEKVFTVTSFSLIKVGEDSPAMGIELVLKEYDSNIFSWSSSEESEVETSPEISAEDPSKQYYNVAYVIKTLTNISDITDVNQTYDWESSSTSEFYGSLYESENKTKANTLILTNPNFIVNLDFSLYFQNSIALSTPYNFDVYYRIDGGSWIKYGSISGSVDDPDNDTGNTVELSEALIGTISNYSTTSKLDFKLVNNTPYLEPDIINMSNITMTTYIYNV